MKIRFTEINSDHSGPVIEVISEDDGDAFELGILFQKLKDIDACVWQLFTGGIILRLPIVMMDEIGLAITYKKEAV
jgi:hypothetical protein